MFGLIQFLEQNIGKLRNTTHRQRMRVQGPPANAGFRHVAGQPQNLQRQKSQG